MKQILYIFLIGTVLCSCTSNTIYKKPKNLISEKEMVNLLVDMYIANGGKSGKNLNGDYGVEYMPYVYEKYKIDSARFAESAFYYQSDIDNYIKLLKKVETRLNSLQDANDVLLEEIDSLNSEESKEALKTLRNRDSIVK